MKKFCSLVAAGAFSTLIPFTAFAYDANTPSSANTQKPANILEAAQKNGGFSIFLAAVEAAEMTAALSSQRMQYTVYAPTDAAFAKLGNEKLAALLQDKEELRRIVAKHVVVGKYASTDINAGTKRTIWGEALPVTTHRNLHVNWIKVVATGWFRIKPRASSGRKSTRLNRSDCGQQASICSKTRSEPL